MQQVRPEELWELMGSETPSSLICERLERKRLSLTCHHVTNDEAVQLNSFRSHDLTHRRWV